MKAERVKTEPKFVPVIVTLESQEEVDSFFVVGNDTRICHALPALDRVYRILKPFNSDHFHTLNDNLDRIFG